MQLPRTPLAYILFSFAAIASTYLIVRLDEATIIALTKEDALVENYGGFFFLLAAALFAVAFFRSEGFPNQLGSIRTKRNVIYLGLAAMFLFAGGEEISWGQRIFGWATPESVMEYNRQGEMNIHNLAVFQGQEGVLNIHFLFSVFWVGYCLGLPLLNRIPAMRAWFAELGIPVTSLWMGGLLLANYVVFKLAAIGFDGEARHGLNELKESNAAFVFAVVAILEVLRVSRGARAETVSADPVEAQPV